MDEYEEQDGVYAKRSLSTEERAALNHIARFIGFKIGTFLVIRRFAKTYRVLGEKRHTRDLLLRINEVADDIRQIKED